MRIDVNVVCRQCGHRWLMAIIETTMWWAAGLTAEKAAARRASCPHCGHFEAHALDVPSAARESEQMSYGDGI